ncbi:MAG: CDP-diacylglycerol--glycerol-3-phosphate 3-phosphatidyltransferase [Oscillospiraceae bacterium]|nr:CDP-diacylglycerol--glycerol-3-phosphate 3-phosphatidyltransferase [Oscillospiraceae bacterium]
MNLANKLTVFRVILVPVFVAFLSISAIPHNLAIALGVFVVASLTDFADGYIARSRNMITEFGKFIDPIADKILVNAALVCFAGLGWIQAWTIAAILARDSIVSAVRLAAVQSKEKVVIPARASGKVKTAVTMLSLCGIMLLWILADYGVITYHQQIFVNPDGFSAAFSELTINDPGLILRPVGNAAMYVCVALTLYSGMQYVWDSRKILAKILKDN